MGTSVSSDAAANTDRFYTQLKSVREFDKSEVNGVLRNLLSPTPRDNCFLGTYFRAQGNVESLLRFDKSKDFQAIVMLARALFELAVDSKLLEEIPDSCGKMMVYADYEKLRSAEKVLEFKAKHPDADVDTTVYSEYIAKHSQRVNNLKVNLWPNAKTLKHWSGLHLGERVTLLKSPFDQIYAVDYPQMSWYVHSGLTGIMNVEAVTFIHLCAHAFHTAVTSYSESLLSVIRVFGLSKVNPHIEKNLGIAKMFPFADTPEQVDSLTRSIQ